MSTELYVLLFSAVLAACEHVTLDLTFSADGARVPSRALLADLTVGVPEQSYKVMLDFNSSVVELEQCMYTKSATYDITGGSSDIVLFEEDELVDPQPHGYYRFPVVEHCVDVGAMPANFYRNCPSGSCAGVLGMSHRSPMWDIWSAYTLMLDAVHLGRDNPRHSRVERQHSIQCNNSEDEKICEYDAVVGGEKLLVDFHMEDSYIYVPQRIYALYIAGRNLYGIAGEEASVTEHLPKKARQFREKLDEDREFAEQHNSYFGSSSAGNSEWQPIVVRPLANGETDQNVILLDYSLLVHSPSYSGSYGNVQRTSSQRFFGERASAKLTLMLKPHPTDPHGNRMSIGNCVLRRYALHKDQMYAAMQIEERLLVEHFSAGELVAMLLLYTFFVFSLVNTLHKMATLSLCLTRLCESCKHPQNPYAHKRRTFHSVFHVFLPLFVLVLAVCSLVHAADFIAGTALATWAPLLLSVNALILLALLVAVPSEHDGPVIDGTFCWRSFRRRTARASSAETLALLALIALGSVLRRDTLGTAVTSMTALAQIFNGARHALQVYFYERALRSATLNSMSLRRADFPGPLHEIFWWGYVFLVLVVCNLCTNSIILFGTVIRPALRSYSLAYLVSITAVFAASMVLDAYLRDTMKSRSFKLSDF